MHLTRSPHITTSVSFLSIRRHSTAPLNKKNRILLAQLQACQNSKEVSAVIRSNPAHFQHPTLFHKLLDRVDSLQKERLRPREIAGLVNSLSKLSTTSDENRRRHQTAMFALSESARLQLRYFHARDLSILLNAIARKYIRNDALFEHAAKVVMFKIESLNSQDLANTANAFAKLNCSSPRLFNGIAKAAIPLIYTFTTQGLANIVNAFAKMNHIHSDLFEAVASQTIHYLLEDTKSFTAQGLSNMVNAFAKVSHSHPELFETVAAAVTQNIQLFNSQNLANTINAFAKMSHFHQDLQDTVSKKSLKSISKFNAQELSNLVNAVAKLKYYGHPEIFDTVIHTSLPILDQFKAQELANLINACAKMNHYNRMLWNGVAEAAVSNIFTFRPQELASMANAFAKMNHQHDKLFRNVTEASLLLMDKFDARNLSNLINAFAKLDQSHERLLESVARKATTIIYKFNSQELANLVSAFARLRADGESIDILFRETSLRIKSDTAYLSTWKEQNMVELVYAFLKANQSDQYLLDRVGTEIISRPSPNFDALGLGNLAAAFSRKETVPSSTKILDKIFVSFQLLPEDEISLQNVADVSKALWLGDKLNLLPLGFIEKMAELAISKVDQSQPSDARDILLNLTSQKLPLNNSKKHELLVTYKPIFVLFSPRIADKHRRTIRNIYEKFNIDI
jgi:hypothetical protein